MRSKCIVHLSSHLIALILPQGLYIYNYLLTLLASGNYKYFNHNQPKLDRLSLDAVHPHHDNNDFPPLNSALWNLGEVGESSVPFSWEGVLGTNYKEPVFCLKTGSGEFCVEKV